MSQSYVNLSNAGRPGDDTYKKVIEKIQTDNVCPFCSEQLENYHKNPVLKEGIFWKVTTNMYPYKNSKHHFLLILNSHKTNTKDISPEEWSELHQHIDWIIETHKILGGTLIMRGGDTAHTGASVAHLHAQFVSPDFENVNREPIIARIG